MASRYFQQARRSCCVYPQRFGPDLVVFPGASTPWHISVACRLVQRVLTQLRRDRTELELSRTSAEYQRLAFVRWLVATGKLSDQLA